MTKVRLLRVTKDEDGMRLDRWFKLHVPEMSHIALQKALRKGQVRVQGKRAKANMRIEKGQEIRVPPVAQSAGSEYTPHEKAAKKPKPQKAPTPEMVEKFRACLIFDGKDFAVLNKPQGLSVQGGTGQAHSVDSLLPYAWPDSEERPKLVHRLDRDTSGVLVVAKTRKAAADLTAAFREKTMEKRYLAVVIGVPQPREGEIKLPIGKGSGGGIEKMRVDEENGQKAHTRYRVLDFALGKAALVELEPVTGRTHQLRVHMEAIGHPILGDGKYGGKNAFIPECSNHLHLHAAHIGLPVKGQKKLREFDAPMPEHMKQTLSYLGLEVA